MQVRRGGPDSSSPRSVPVGDLLDVPYVAGGLDPATGLDCLGHAIEVHRRLGKFQPQFAVDRAGAANWLLGPGWASLGCDAATLRELGDVVVTREPACATGPRSAPGGQGLGVAVLVDVGAPPRLLTATPSGGARVLSAAALWRLVGPGGVEGIYRWRGLGRTTGTTEG